MVLSKKNNNIISLEINNEQIERVIEKNEATKEITIRIAKARNALKRVLTRRDLSLELKTRLVKCYIYSILLYMVRILGPRISTAAPKQKNLNYELNE